jgi:hypothetical protein
MSATSRASPAATGVGHDGGMVTIESAIALSAFITVLAVVLAGVTLVFDQLGCTDAAREAARLVARGEQDGVAAVVKQIAPDGATFTVTTTDDGIVVAVRDPAASRLLPGVQVVAEAFAVPEPDADDDTDGNTGTDTGSNTDTGTDSGTDSGAATDSGDPGPPPSTGPSVTPAPDGQPPAGTPDGQSRSTGGGGR